MKPTGPASGTAAWTLGILLLLQMTGLIVPYVLLHPISGAQWLTTASAARASILIGCAGLLLTCAITIILSLRLRTLISPSAQQVTKVLIGTSILVAVLQCLDVACLLRMLGASGEYVRDLSVASAASDLAAQRRVVHYSALLSIDAWMFLFYGLLYHARPVPRALATFGLLTVALHFFGLLLPMILGLRGVTALGAMMALSHVVLAGWLIFRGTSPSVAMAEPA